MFRTLCWINAFVIYLIGSIGLWLGHGLEGAIWLCLGCLWAIVGETTRIATALAKIAENKSLKE